MRSLDFFANSQVTEDRFSDPVAIGIAVFNHLSSTLGVLACWRSEYPQLSRSGINNRIIL